jgi:RNA polymerase sigma factor (sigma-70 family)
VGQVDHRAAYEALLRHYLQPLRRLAWSYEHEPAARDDLFQEIATSLWTALPRFRGDSSERTWVYRIAHNTAISFATHGRRRRTREQPGEAPREPAVGAAQEADAIERQQRDRLWAAVQDLPVVDREITVLYLEGLSATEIEGVTGISAGAIATRLTRVRQKLAAQFRAEAAARKEKWT